jgi:hypothetical protein
MISYKDKTFCSFWMLCRKSHGCGRELTREVLVEAEKLGLPISQFAEKPSCFVALWEDE